MNDNVKFQRFAKPSRPSPDIIAIVNCPIGCDWNIKLDIERIYDSFECINAIKDIVENHLKDHDVANYDNDQGMPEIGGEGVNSMDL